MLHTVNKSPFEKNSFDSCLRLAKSGSDILLIEDGVYAALPDTSLAARMEQVLGEYKIFALGPDLQARGLAEDHLIDGIQVIDYHGFVQLAVANEHCQAWL